MSSFSLGYQDGWQTLELVAAYTEKADGRQLPAHGKLSGKLTVKSSGSAAMVLTMWLDGIPGGEKEGYVRKPLADANRRGSGKFVFAPLSLDGTEQQLEVDLQISDCLENREAGLVAANPTVPGLPVYILDHIASYSADYRRFALPCTPVRVRESIRLRFDPVWSVRRVSKPTTIETKDVRFTSTYSYKDHVLVGTREYVDSNPSMLCNPYLYSERTVAQRTIRKLRGEQLLYEKE